MKVEGQRRFTAVAIHIISTCAFLATGAAGEDLLTPQEFSQRLAEKVRAERPRAVVEVVEPLRLRLKIRESDTGTLHLDDAYDTYKVAPDSLDEVLQRYVDGSLEALTAVSKVDTTRIVPMVKSRSWLKEMLASARQPGAGEPLVYDVLNDLLVIVYAEDTPNSVSYFGADDLKKTSVERDALRQLAADNLLRMLPQIERRGEHGIYRVSAGGDFEASLLAVGDVWKRENFEVKGDFVFAVPTKGVLYVTGSDDPEAIRKVRRFAATDFRDSTFKLAKELFVLRAGQLLVLPE